jgi:DNA-directed RNA polymerase subunit RPC12/RpoP
LIPRCPKCRSRIIQKSADGKLKIRTNIVVFGPQGAEVVCRKCGSDVPVDLHLGEPLRKALQESEPPLVVRKEIDTVDRGP